MQKPDESNAQWLTMANPLALAHAHAFHASHPMLCERESLSYGESIGSSANPAFTNVETLDLGFGGLPSAAGRGADRELLRSGCCPLLLAPNLNLLPLPLSHMQLLGLPADWGEGRGGSIMRPPGDEEVGEGMSGLRRKSAKYAGVRSNPSFGGGVRRGRDRGRGDTGIKNSERSSFPWCEPLCCGSKSPSSPLDAYR